MALLSTRSEAITPFYVMELVKQAESLEKAGRSIVHLSIGEPDFTAPDAVVDAARRAIEAGLSRYTSALGLPQLRQSICGWYRDRFGLDVGAERIVITAGASGALVLAVAALLDAGDEVLLPDPSYPCNRHIVTASGALSRLIACPPATRFQLDADAVRAQWGPRTRGVLIASPSNPTGTTVAPGALAGLASTVLDRGGFLVVDEIYQGLTYDHPSSTALSIDPRIVVINSFSKYFGMTGWRLGWLVVPAQWTDAFERLAQNLYICPSAVAQYAALACFEASSVAVFEQRREQFRKRRDFLLPELARLGLQVPVVPDGAFYIYADMREAARRRAGIAEDSSQMAQRLLHEAGVCLVPGKDFGTVDAGRYLRLSYATSMEKLQEAMARLRPHLAGG
jgi:aspartate/methionine/tyrosine aminotransferase